MKKIALPLLLLLLFLIVLIANQQRKKTVSHPEQPERIKISLFHYFSGSLSGGFSEMIETVNSENSHQQVIAQALDHEAFKTMIHTTLDKGNPPELFSYWAGAKTQTLVDAGKLEPIDTVFQQSNISQYFTTPVTKVGSTYSGKRYLLPITQHFVVFFYNRAVFQNLDLAPPASWDEFILVLDRLKKDGIIPIALGARERWPAQFWFDYLLLRTAGPEYRQQLMEGKVKYTDKEVREVYKLWGDLLQKDFFNNNSNSLNWDEATNLLCSKQAAMTLMGTWAIQALIHKDCGLPEEKGFDFFVFPVIDKNIPEVAVGPVDGLVLTKGSANLEFAKKVLSYFGEMEPQKKISEGSGAFAPSSQVPSNFYSPLKKRILDEIESAEYWAFNYDLATPLSIANKGMDSFNEIIAFPDQVDEILNNLQKEVELIMTTE